MALPVTAEAGRRAAAATGELPALPPALSAALTAYSQVILADHRGVGALLLLATALSPRLGLHGLAAVLLGRALVGLLGLSEAASARGRYGYNPLLIGLAVGALFEPGPGAAALLALAVVAVVFLEASLDSVLGAALDLPSLSLPFVLVTWLALAAAPFVGIVARAAPALVPPAPPPWLPAAADLYLRSLGAILFSPSLGAGVVVLAALVLYSRIATLLTLLGYAVSAVLSAQVFTFASDPSLLVLHANAMLAAVALGGVWFVPQRAAFLLAGAAALLTSLGTAGALALFRPLGLPVLFLPFNVTMLVALTALRQRVRDGAPKAVDFAAGSPEANLAFYRTRVARFGPGHGVRFAPPFAGRWVVTQGVDGAHTHRGAWRHALDFEVADASGATHGGDGRELRDHRCYRLPVLAAADGTVVKVVGDVPDNAPGAHDARRPFGNLVLLQHGPGLFSLVAHLAPGSLEVKEGQVVRQGARLGACGNSGRSFVPHLHFQLQGTPRVGAPTLELSLADVITGDEAAPVLHRWLVPEEGQVVRGLVRRDEGAVPFALPIGGELSFEVEGPQGQVHQEVVVSRIGLLGELTLECPATGARLWFENQGRQFVVYDQVGRRDGALHLLAAAAPRVPYELPDGLAWDDVLPRRRFRPRWVRWVTDLAEPFLPEGGVAVSFTATRRGEVLEVRGQGRAGGRALQTTATFDAGGPRTMEVRLDQEAWRARRVERAAEVDRG
ncbi:MAG: urea transporter [Anaeromyxobacter sp.]|nr:urea transporter [Anaeromyxobacter sp.]MBL0278516.1 urea transporter [Anaeromyxobacter sp.]